MILFNNLKLNKMISSFQISTNIANEFTRDFIESSVKNFYQEIENYYRLTKRRDKYHLAEYGEMAMVNNYINGIARSDEGKYFQILNELELENNSERVGRVDIIVEDTLCHNMYYIEAKKLNSKQDAPKTNEWLPKQTKEFYNKILKQANRYLEADHKCYEDIWDPDFYSVALVFDFVRFENIDFIKGWTNYDVKHEEEFYAFKTFNHNGNTIGLACYGILQKYELKNWNPPSDGIV